MTWDLHADAAKISSGSPAIKTFAQHVADILQPVTPPPPPPPSPRSMRVGVDSNVAGWPERQEQRVLQLGVNLIREDAVNGDAAIPWAKANGVDVILILQNGDTSRFNPDAYAVELDNEPYSSRWFDGNYGAWAQRMLAAAKTLRETKGYKRPIIVPIGPTWNGTDGTVNGIDAVKLLHTTVPALFDTYGVEPSVHPYSQPNGALPGHFATLDKLRASLKSVGHDVPFWVTEIGWPTGGTNWPAATEAQQATWLGQFIDTCKTRGDVRTVMVYKLSDDGTGGGTDSEQYFGLVRYDGTHKPAYDVVKARL